MTTDLLSEDLKETIREVHNGWYREGRIDWEDFLDKVEQHADVDLGTDLLSPLVKAIKAYVKEYRKLEA